MWKYRTLIMANKCVLNVFDGDDDDDDDDEKIKKLLGMKIKKGKFVSLFLYLRHMCMGTYIFNVYITNLLIHSMSRCQRKNIYTTSLQCYHIFKNRRHDVMYNTEDKCKMQTLCECMFMWEPTNDHINVSNYCNVVNIL